jgi:hypothetical protein
MLSTHSTTLANYPSLLITAVTCVVAACGIMKEDGAETQSLVSVSKSQILPQCIYFEGI